jgi:hypothetical protein
VLTVELGSLQPRHPVPLARIDDAHDYRVYGRLGSVAQTTFGVYGGKDDQAQAVKALSDDLVIDDDGSFEIFFSQETWEPPTSFSFHLALTPFAPSKFTATGNGNTRGRFASSA